MGLKAAVYRLAPTDDSLKTGFAGPSSSQLFHIAVTLACPQKKVKCFPSKDLFFVIGTISHFLPGEKMAHLPVDKPGGLWFNDTCTYIKDNDGKLTPFECSREPAAGASRCGQTG